MKKTLLFALALLLSVTMFAQNRASLINETFEGSTLPSGWSIDGSGMNNWEVSTSCKAGGEANEMLLYWSPEFNGISRLVAPAVNLSNAESVVVSFKHYFDNYSGTSAIGIATSSDGTTWNQAWQQNYSTSGQYSVSQIISTEDMGKDNVRICIYFSGDSYNINNWYFDDIEIFTQENLDLRIVSIDVAGMMGAGETDIVFTVQNIGKTNIESFEAKFNSGIADATDVTETFTASIAPMETKQFTFSESVLYNPDAYNLPIEIVNVNNTTDDDATNNSLNKDIFVAMGETQRIPMIEHFSSSTCGPCVSVNYAMNQLTAANPGKYTYVKYQMNWPGSGDAYYTEEGGVRRDYYGVNAVPWLYFDADNINNTTQSILDEYYAHPAFADVRGAFNIEGNTINITADFMSYAQMNNVRAFIVVNEKETTGNAGSNGETSFHHVMMKMLDGANGNTISINAGEYQRLEFSYDLSSTNVEDMNDLEVALWLQDFNTKRVYNSRFAYEYTDHAYPVQNLTATTSETTLEISWEAPEAGTPAGYNLYIDGELVEENYTELTYVNEEMAATLNDGNYHNTKVVALYENEKTSVPVVKEIISTVNVTEVEENELNIFPNPVKDAVKIQGNNINSVNVYNSVGVLVERIEAGSNEVEINMNDYNTGIYFVQVNTENGTTTRKVVKL
jgi:hypothetical protein